MTIPTIATIAADYFSVQRLSHIDECMTVALWLKDEAMTVKALTEADLKDAVCLATISMEYALSALTCMLFQLILCALIKYDDMGERLNGALGLKWLKKAHSRATSVFRAQGMPSSQLELDNVEDWVSGPMRNSSVLS